jgi:putative sigma-54 modulation protein
MQIHIHCQGFDLTEGLRTHIERRIHFTFSWASEHIRRVTVRLSDENGKRGGVDKRCRFLVGVNGAADVVVSEINSDMYVAIDRAGDRTGRTISRILSKKRSYPHEHLMHENITVIGTPDRIVGQASNS